MKDARLIADRYARAMAQAVTDDRELARVRDDVARLAGLAEQSVELRRALGNPVVASAQKLAVLKSLAGRLDAAPATLRFLDVLAANDRLAVLDEIALAVSREADRRAGIVEVEVRTAAPLDTAVRARLAPVLERLAGSRVRTREVVDPSLLGGLVLRVSGTVYDGSIKTRLEKMRARLAGGTAGGAAAAV